MLNLLDTVPTALIMLMVAVLVLGVSEAAFWAGRAHAAQYQKSGPSDVVQAATFTVLALLLGFSFSLALGRFDARRETFVREANAIGTTYLRTDLLDAKAASQAREQLRDYLALRIDYARSDANPVRRAEDARRSEALQSRLWALAMARAARDPHSTTAPLFVATLNDTIDLSTTESAILSAHIPDVVIGGLILIAVVATGMMGFGFGAENKRATIPKILYAIVLAITIGLVLDLDRPQRGFIRVDLTAMQTLQRDIGPPSANALPPG